MKEKRVDLGYGVVERRFYDKQGKLVEVRKEHPPDTLSSRVGIHFKRSPGTKGGHF